MKYEIAWRDIADQRLWSDRTFGPGQRLKGVLAHLRKETHEVEDTDGRDIMEWADLLILVIDGATRSGHFGQDLINAYHEKMAENRRREWPDWRDFSEDEPIEHIKPGTNSVASGYVEEYRRMAGGAVVAPEEDPR